MYAANSNRCIILINTTVPMVPNEFYDVLRLKTTGRTIIFSRVACFVRFTVVGSSKITLVFVRKIINSFSETSLVP